MGLLSVGLDEVRLTFVVASEVGSKLIKNDSAGLRVEEEALGEKTVQRGKFLDVEEDEKVNEI